MKFDVIVGNPPYQDADSKGIKKHLSANLWTHIWYKSLNLLKKNGIVSLICPEGWLSPSEDVKGKPRLWTIFNQYTSFARVNGVNSYFSGVGSTFSYIVVDTSGKSGLSFHPSDGNVDISLGFKPRSNPKRVNECLSSQNNLSSYFQISRGKRKTAYSVSIPMTKAVLEKNVEILRRDEQPKTETNNFYFIHVNTIDEANNVKKSIISCLDVLNQHARWSGFLNRGVVDRIIYNGTTDNSQKWKN